jgi:hypothetical protein
MLPLMLACAGSTPPTPSDPDLRPVDSDAPEVSEFAPASRASLKMKRWRQLSLDLQGALELTEDQVCREAGLYDCSALHVVPLGGLSRDNGVFEPRQELAVTTTLAVERVTLQACWNRLELDRAADTPAVFHADLLEGSDASQDELEAQATELVRRFWARDPLPEELGLLTGLHAGVLEDGGGDAEWAWLTCFTVATSSEALLY